MNDYLTLLLLIKSLIENPQNDAILNLIAALIYEASEGREVPTKIPFLEESFHMDYPALKIFLKSGLFAGAAFVGERQECNLLNRIKWNPKTKDIEVIQIGTNHPTSSTDWYYYLEPIDSCR